MTATLISSVTQFFLSSPAILATPMRPADLSLVTAMLSKMCMRRRQTQREEKSRRLGKCHYHPTKEKEMKWAQDRTEAWKCGSCKLKQSQFQWMGRNRNLKMFLKPENETWKPDFFKFHQNPRLYSLLHSKSHKACFFSPGWEISFPNDIDVVVEQ